MIIQDQAHTNLESKTNRLLHNIGRHPWSMIRLGTEPREYKIDQKSPGPLNYRPEKTVIDINDISKHKLISLHLDWRLKWSEINWILLDQVHTCLLRMPLRLLNTLFNPNTRLNLGIRIQDQVVIIIRLHWMCLVWR